MSTTELQLALACLEKIRQTGSILDKKALLKRFDSPTLRKILQLAYDNQKFGYGPEAKQELYHYRLLVPYDVSMWWEETLSLLENRQTQPPALIMNSLEHSPDGHHQTLLIGILTKDLRLGLREKSILEVFPNLFEVFNVQLAKPFNPAKLQFPCAVEPKFDGVRAVYLNGCYLSRYGQELQGPKISCPREWVLDGELVAGHFQDTLSAVRIGGDLRYYVFDTIPRSEWDSKTFTLSNLERNAQAPEVLEGTLGVTRLWCLDQASIEAAHAHNLSLGFEGSMVKANVPYELKRSYSWMKIKPTLDMDVRVVGWTPGEGKYTGMLGAYVCEIAEGKRFNLGTGINDDARILTQVDPKAVINHICEITYQELTLDGIPRFARFKRWRSDKEAP